MVKYNLYFSILHMEYLECEILVNSVINQHYEERQYTSYIQASMWNENQISYYEYRQEVERLTMANTSTKTDTEEIKKKNENILKSFIKKGV